MNKFIRFIDGVGLKESLEPRSKNHKETQFLKIRKNQSFISLKQENYDPFGAAEGARNLLTLNISIYRLYDHEYRYSINTAKCGVYENTNFYRIPFPKSAVTHMRMPSDKQIKDGMENSANAIVTAFKNSYYDLPFTIMKAIEFHSHSLDSLSKENQLLDFWAIFESVLNISNKHTSDRIQQICMYLVPILKRKYLYSLFKQLSFDIKKYSEEEYQKIVGDSTDEKIVVQTICEFALLPSNKELRDEFISKCNDFPLIKERIIYYNNVLSSHDKIYDFVEKHAERVRWHVMRIYRNRNLIIHNGKSMTYLNLLIENLHSYVDEFLEYIMKSAADGHTIDSMRQELCINECKWNNQFFRNKNDINSETIKNMLSY